MRWVSLVVGAMQLAGCVGGGSSDLPPDREKALRSNFDRPLNAEEIAMMGKAKPAPMPKKGK